MIRTLSKTSLISAWQCRKKLHLEKLHPELGEVSEATERLFAMGHEVGAIAQDGTDNLTMSESQSVDEGICIDV